MDTQAIPEIERERSALDLIGDTFRLYRRLPWLFYILAAIVVVPYTVLQVVELDLPRGVLPAFFGIALAVADLALVLPLVSAFHIVAVDDLRRGVEPSFASVCRRGVGNLQSVSAATVVSWFGITIGFVALIVPGVILMLRWSVVAQSAALRTGSWRDALDHSRDLTDDRYRHVFAFLVLLLLVIAVPSVLLSLLIGFRFSIASYVVRLPLSVATTSFDALAAALLFFDLSARSEVSEARVPAGSIAGGDPNGHPLDPDSYSDADRAPGWYVVPATPWRMRYWAGGDPAHGWSRKTMKTPRKTQRGWWRIKDR